MDLTWSNMIYIQESGNWMIPRLSLFDFQNYIKYYKIIWVERSFVTVFIIHFDRHKDRDVTQRIGILIKMLEIKIDIVNQQGKKLNGFVRPNWQETHPNLSMNRGLSCHVFMQTKSGTRVSAARACTWHVSWIILRRGWK